MTNQTLIRQQLQQLLDGRNAHMTFDDAVANFPFDLINTRPPNVPYSFWHLVEHLRIAQWDILDFIHNANYIALEWPAGHQPTRHGPRSSQTKGRGPTMHAFFDGATCRSCPCACQTPSERECRTPGRVEAGGRPWRPAASRGPTPVVLRRPPRVKWGCPAPCPTRDTI